MKINTNMESMLARRRLAMSTASVARTSRKLGSGLRITQSSDDAAGSAISTRLTSQVRGLNQSIRNTNDVISLVQVADGALEETVSAMQRVRELAVQSANDTMTSADRQDTGQEMMELLVEIDRIASDTEFNTQALLNGSFNGTFMIGAFGNNTVTFSINAATVSATTGMTYTYNPGATISGVDAASDWGTILSNMDSGIASVNEMRSKLGSLQKRFESIIENQSIGSNNTSHARSRLMDADISLESAKLVKGTILTQAGTSVLAQANQNANLALQLLG